MDKLKTKEVQLEKAIAGMGKASATVKQLTADVKKGLASHKELEAAISDLKNKGGDLKIIHAEAKVLSGYERVTFNDIAPSFHKENRLWIFASIIALAYIVFK